VQQMLGAEPEQVTAKLWGVESSSESLLTEPGMLELND